MIEMSPMDLMFINFIFSVTAMGSLLLVAERYLPVSLSKTFRYGKFQKQGGGEGGHLVPRVPKSWFSHFYYFSVVWCGLNMYFLCRFLAWGTRPPSWLLTLLDWFCRRHGEPTYNAIQCVVGLTLLSIQCCRRWYETVFLQVFSEKAKINLMQYFVGVFHYFGCITIIMAGMDFRDGKSGPNAIWAVFQSVPTIVIFLYAWKKQYESNVILANLRKDPSGKNVISQKYRIPSGGLFELVSSPHNLTEILMYAALTVLLGNWLSWLYVFLWVFANQIQTALFSHRWYLETFNDYPKGRKAIMPYIL